MSIEVSSLMFVRSVHLFLPGWRKLPSAMLLSATNQEWKGGGDLFQTDANTPMSIQRINGYKGHETRQLLGLRS